MANLPETQHAVQLAGPDKLVLNTSVPDDVFSSVEVPVRNAVIAVLEQIQSGKKLTEEKIVEIFKTAMSKDEISFREFFRGFYRILFSRDKGPRLSSFLIAVDSGKLSVLLKDLRKKR